MKVRLIMYICMVVMLRADWQRVIGSSEVPIAPKKEVMQSDTMGLYLRTEIFGFTETDTSIGNNTFQRIVIPNEELDRDTTRAGKPQIPFIRLLIAVPDSCPCSLMVEINEAVDYSDYFLYPVPRIEYLDSAGIIYCRDVYAYDTSFYQKDTLYPDKIYEIVNDGHWRGQRVLEVLLYPVQYNPLRKTMHFYPGIDLRIEYTGNTFPNTYGLGPFEDIGRDILLNYPGIEREPAGHPAPAVHYYTYLQNPYNDADYIIVTHDAFLLNETTYPWIQNFAQWRVDHNHFDVGVVTMQDVYEEFLEPPYDDSAYALWKFLKYAYDNWQAHTVPDGHFAYCVFIGDWDYVPTKLHYDGQWLVANDRYFANLEGNATFVEIMLGRWPVKPAQSLITIAQKTINYEKYPTLGGWRRTGLLMNWFDWREKSFFIDINYDTICVSGSNGFCDSVQKYLNYGEIIADYCGHGGPEAWMYGYDTSYVKALQNGNNLPIILSNGCLTAMFQWDHPESAPPNYPPSTSFGEHFLLNPNGGCIAFYGATCNTGSFYGKLALERILHYQSWVLGKALINFGQGGENEYCLLGDPALDLGDYTAYPTMPDLLVRPTGIDVSLLEPHPYITTDDLVPIQVSVWNIGAVTASNINVKIRVKTPLIPDTAVITTINIPQIKARDSVTVQFMWDPTIYHLESGGTIVLPDGLVGNAGPAEFIFVVDPNNTINESWEGNNRSKCSKPLFFYPYEQNWPKKMLQKGLPGIANLDNAGSVEITCIGLDSLHVFDKDGNELSGWPQYFQYVHSMVLGDINDDGFIEIIAVSNQLFRAYDYGGHMLWEQNIPYNGRVSLPALGCISPTGTVNIIIFIPRSFHNKILVYDYDGSLLYDFDSYWGGACPGICAGPVISDINNDGNEEIVVSYDYAEAVGDQYICKTEVFNCNGFISSLDYGNESTISALADLNNDVIPDITLGCADSMMRAYDAAHNQMLWECDTDGEINTSPAIGNIHPFISGVEVAFGNDTSRIYLLRGTNGTPIFPWWCTIAPNTRVRSSPAIANINGDRYLDVIIAAHNGFIYAFKHTKELIPPFPMPLFGTPNSPLIGDIDGDSKSEIVLYSSDAYLHIWHNQNSWIPQYSLEWPQFHHDYQRTGLYGWIGILRGTNIDPQEFSSTTTLSFTLDKETYSVIKIYDSEANLVRTLVDQVLPTGTHSQIWNGKNTNFTLLPNGVYFIEIKVQNESTIIPVTINR